MRIFDLGRMDITRVTPLASIVSDQPNVTLLDNWTNGELAVSNTCTDWRLGKFGLSSSFDETPTADHDGDGAGNQSEFLAGTLPVNWNFLSETSATTARGANGTFWETRLCP